MCFLKMCQTKWIKIHHFIHYSKRTIQIDQQGRLPTKKFWYNLYHWPNPWKTSCMESIWMLPLLAPRGWSVEDHRMLHFDSAFWPPNLKELYDLFDLDLFLLDAAWRGQNSCCNSITKKMEEHELVADIDPFGVRKQRGCAISESGKACVKW